MKENNDKIQKIIHYNCEDTRSLRKNTSTDISQRSKEVTRGSGLCHMLLYS